jgi:UDP-apiose/xylose synthase
VIHTNIALFGGAGFIGSHLARRLLREDYHLTIVDIDDEKIADVRSDDRVDFYELDIRDGDDGTVGTIIEAADVVIDLIAYANPKQYVDMPLEVVHLNYDQNLRLVEDCVATDTRLIQFSTSEVYGKTGGRTGEDLVFSEDSSDLTMGPVENHRWIYATAKQLLERMVHAHGIENDLDWTVIRPFNFIGREMDYLIEEPDAGTPRVFASFMSALLYDHPMYLVDGGENRRSFTHISDAVEAMVYVIDGEERYNREVVNVGTPGNETTIHDLAYLMRDVYEAQSGNGSVPPIETVSGAEFYGEGYEDCERRIPDVTKLTDAGWEPQYDLRETLEEAMSYYVEKYDQPEAVSLD